jgi:hypothetical protein
MELRGQYAWEARNVLLKHIFVTAQAHSGKSRKILLAASSVSD